MGKDVVSWKGIQNLTYANITSQLFPAVTKADLTVSGYPIANWKNRKLHMTALNGVCLQIDLNITNLSPSDMFYVYLRRTRKTSLKDMNIIITYPGNSLYYMINSDYVEGDKPVTHDAGILPYYFLTIEEVYMLEESGECKNYGETAKFKSFADCVADEQKRMFKPIIGCTPPWTTALDDQDACNGLVTSDIGTFRKKLRELEKRIGMSSILHHSSACLKPCFEVKIKSKFLKAVATKRKGVWLNFEKSVKVTKYIKVYGLFDLVVEVGSCLGLWIGISALGVCDLVLDTALWLKTKINGIHQNNH